MHFRRSAALVLAAAALVAGCQKSIDDRGLPQGVAVAVFDPTRNAIPLPNDLALASVATAAAAGCPAAFLPTAQAQFLCALRASGGFPNDQEVALSFGFQGQSVNGGGTVDATPVALDPTTIKVLGAVAGPSATVAVFDVTFAPTVTPVVVEASYDAAAGTLKLRKPAATDGSRRWTQGHRYAAFVRGGPGGVKAAGGGEVAAMPTMFVLREAIVSGRSLTDPANQSLLPGTPEQKAAAAAQLEPIRVGYAPLRPVFEGAFSAPFQDLVNLLTFTIAPSQGVVIEVDATKGSAPLPIDLLRAPDAAGGKILDNAAFGAARAGLVTLDGFSTTAPLTAPLTGGVATIDAATVGTASGNVLVFDLSTSPPTLLKEFNQQLQTGGPAAAQGAAYVAQPTGTFVPAGLGLCPSANLAGPIGGCASTLVLQPAVPITAAATYLPPLKGATKYAVVVTKRVKDVLGRPLGRSTVARILLELTAPVDTSIGIDAGTAALLQQMRTDLAPVLANLPTGTTKADLAMAWVFRTQTVTTDSLKLSAAPYGIEAAAAGAQLFVPQSVTTVTSSFPQVTNAAAIYAVTFTSVDVTSRVTGALDPTAIASPAAHLVALRALVAVPPASAVTTACPGGVGLQCAPLVVFGHGLGGGKESAFATVAGAAPPASALLARGFVVAAVDFPQHGARTWCFVSTDCDAAGSPAGTGDGTCTPFPELAALSPPFQSDLPSRPGVCTGGSTPNPATSGRTFIGANFFRTRDAFRQNLLDQSALVLALARPTPVVNAFTTALGGLGVAVNPASVSWEGISLGGMAGTEVVATNPRFGRGVTSVAGGTLVDVFTRAPRFQAQVNALFTTLLQPQLAAAGLTTFDPSLVDPSNVTSFVPAVAAAYGKTLLVAKWILDPGDPLNFARHLKVAPLPNLLVDPTGATPQAPKSVLGQVATGDIVVPNPFNLELFVNGQVDRVTYVSSGAYLSPQNVIHGMLGFDPTVQADAAAYLQSPLNVPASPVSLP